MKINDAFPSKYLKASDLHNVPNREIALTIDRVVIEDVGMENAPEQKPVMYFVGGQKGLVMNRTNAMNIEVVYGDETDDWVGKKVLMFIEPVMFAGKRTEGLRVRGQPEAGNGPLTPRQNVMTQPLDAQNAVPTPTTPPPVTQPAGSGDLDDEIPF